MKFGLFGINTGTAADPEVMKKLSLAAEAAGFESLWTGEHVVLPDPQVPPSPAPPLLPFVHPFTALSFIAAITEKGTGETISLDLVSHNQHGVLVESTLFTLFVRGPSGGTSESRRSGEEEDRSRSQHFARVTQKLDDDQTFRYSEASGDRTKIHLDAVVARRAGLPGIIGHGLCTMAFGSKVLVDELCDADPTRLARMSLRFARPVIPGEEITTSIWQGEETGLFEFQTVDPRGKPVLSQGFAEIRGEGI